MAEPQESTRKVNIDEQKAAEGLKLFAAEGGGSVEYDTDAAGKFQTETDEKIKTLEAEAKELTGKDNKKARTEKSKEVSNIKNSPMYIDACKVVKGLEPKNGNFIKSKVEAVKAVKEEKKEEAPKEEKKEAPKKAAKADAAGISKAERDELEKLKTSIVSKKTELKAAGMSGGQQNKDPEVAAMVARMNELKEKETPGSTAKGGKDKSSSKKKGALTTEQLKEMEALKEEIELYRGKLTSEFGYTKKEIKADPEMLEMEEKLKAFEKRG